MFKHSIFSFITYFILSLSPLIALIDIETKPQDFVLELKRIQIPGHPFAFNASIVRWKGTLLMSYWQVEEPCLNQIASAAVSRVGLVWLDDDFNPIGDPYSLDFGTPISRAQDLRLVEAGDDLYIVYNDNLDEVVTEGGFRMWTGKLDFDGLQFQIFDLQELKYYDWENPRRREKSWIPFDYQGGLHLAYSISPHLIFRTFDGTSCCQSIAVTQPDLHWRWGEPRGGTPAIQIKEGYLSFFHSSIYFPSVHSDGLVVPHYFMGAYIFSKKPPFEIKRVSPRPIIAKGFYSGETYPYYWKPICVVFPCGILVEKKYIWITYGRQDHEIWVAKIDRKKLLKSLIPIGQKPLPSKWDSWKGLCGND